MKKRYYVLNCLIALTSILIGCSKEELKLTDFEEKPNLTAREMSMRADVNPRTNLLGYGYDVTGEYANASAAKFLVIDVNRLERDESTRVFVDFPRQQIGIIHAGVDARDYTRGLSSKVDADHGDALSFFKATITARYKDSTAFSSKFIYSSYDLLVQQKRAKFNAGNALLMDYLTPSFVADVQNQSAAYIVTNYGTHILKDIVLGAKLEVFYRSETTKEDRFTAASAGIDVKLKGIFNLNTGLSYNATDAKDNFSQSLYFRTMGGNPALHIVDEVPVGKKDPVINIGPWQNSSTDENAVLIQIAEGGLIPIYEVISDPVKKAEVKAYINQYLLNNQINIVNEPPALQIYRCFQARTNDRLLTADPNEVAGSPTWQVEGPFAKIYPNNLVVGTIALHRFYIPSSQTHLYSLDKNELSPSAGKYEGILGYVLAKQVPGTLPLVRYYNTRGHHMFSVGMNELGWGSGDWIYEGILGYVLP